VLTSSANRRLLVEVAIVMALLAGSSLWATRFWNAWTAQGGEPVFYQHYFEPAVMIACGRGFVAAQSRPPALEDFLNRRRDSFDCRDLPGDLHVGREYLFQGAWIYLLTTVGWSWRLLGISWSRMGPLFGLLFGIVIALAYGIFRLGMGRVMAIVCALGLATSYVHLINLPHLRDYAKAPFALALVLILGLVVTRPVRRVTLLGLAAAYGGVLGIGYGFRTDFLANLPALALVLFAFLDGGVFKHLSLKVAATLLYVATFVVVSWPVTSLVYKQGGCQWHVALLGLQSPFDGYLRVAPAPYDFGHAYSDGFIYWTIAGYEQRMNPAAGHLTFCSHEYDVQSGHYLRDIASAFPADLIVRAYASVLQVVEMPFLSWASPLTGWVSWLYEARETLLRPRIGWGVYVCAAALLVASGASLRIGVFLLFMLAYWGGYPAIQFQDRHHFHLEFITWWAFGFLVHRAAVALWSLRRGLPPATVMARGLGRSAALAAATAVFVTGVLGVARWYQRRQAWAIFDAYIAAPKMPLAADGSLPPDPGRTWPELLEVELDEAACGPKPAVTFRHQTTPADGDLSRTMTLTHRATAPGVTRIFLPVFETFKAVEFSDARPGCVTGAYRVADLRPFPLVLGVTLPADWKNLALHQRLQDWERAPSP
jgi:hypothetical protein